MAAAASAMACAVAPACSVSMSRAACEGRPSAVTMAVLRSSFRGVAVSGSLHSSSRVRAVCCGLAAQRTMAPIVAASGYKLKTHKASAKRFRVTGSGKIVRRQAGKAHLLRKKTTKRKNRLTGLTDVTKGDYDNVIGALPYLKDKRIDWEERKQLRDCVSSYGNLHSFGGNIFYDPNSS